MKYRDAICYLFLIGYKSGLSNYSDDNEQVREQEQERAYQESSLDDHQPTNKRSGEEGRWNPKWELGVDFQTREHLYLPIFAFAKPWSNDRRR
jgi:hypothetical protein